VSVLADNWRLRSGAYVGTVGTEVAVLLAKLAIYHLAARTFDDPTLGAYLVATQIIAVSQTLVVIGTDVALTRALATESDPSASRTVSSALSTSLGAAVITAAALLVLREEAAGLLFHDRERGAVIAGVAAMLLGAALHPVVAAWFRGRERFGRANVLQVVVHVGVPIPAILLSGGSLPLALGIIGLGWFCASAVFLASDRPAHLKPHVDRGLVRFGLTRAGADLLQVGFLATPVVIAPRVTTLANAGDIAFGIAVVTMIGSTFVPLGLVFLPRVARNIANARQEIADLARRIVFAAAGIGALGTVAAWTTGGWVMRSFLERTDEASATYFKILSLAAVPYTVYVGTRRILDGLTVRAVNTSNLAFAFTVLVISAVVASISRSAYWLCGGFVLATWLLGGMSIRALVLLRRDLLDAKVAVT